MDTSKNDIVPENEQITRYILNKKHFNKNTGRILPKVFIPRKSDTEISVYRTTKLTNDQIWEIANQHVEDITKNRIVYARADIDSKEIYKIGKFVKEKKPPELHCVIEPIPQGFDQQDRKNRVDIANEIVTKSKLSIKN